jgi:uncharacterized protein (DUF305 family)
MMSTASRSIVLLIRFGQRQALPLMIVILLVAMTGVPSHSQHSSAAPHSTSELQAWHDLQRSMLAMHQAMSSISSTANNDEDFVQLMLPHHQAALDMAKVELTHGKDPQMRRLAQEIIADQQSEIELMQLWLAQKHAAASPSAAKEK